MRNHQQHKENNINSNNNNNNNNNNNSNPTNRYQFCLHPVMSGSVTAQHSSVATAPTVMNNHTSPNNHTATTTNATSLNINTNTSTNSVNNNNTALSPTASKSNTNDTLNSQQMQFIAAATTPTATKLSTALFNATKTNLSTSTSSASASSLSPSNTATLSSASSASSLTMSGATIATSSSIVALSPLTPSLSKASAATTPASYAAMSQTVAQQLTKLNNNSNNNNNNNNTNNDDHPDPHHHQHNHQHNHEQIIKNNNKINTNCLNESRKSINSTTKSFKENNHNNNNNSNSGNSNSNNNSSNNSNNNNSNCNNNQFTELMQRNNNNNNHKRLSPTQESSNMSFSSASVAGSIQDDIGDQCGLTKAGLEEYTMRSNSFYDNPVLYHHQKQSSYAQSEGYHSYVSSSDSTSATPMLDRLRQESELLSRQTSSHHWSQNDLSSLASTSVAASPTLLLSSGRDLSELSSCTQQQQQQMQQHNNSSESTSSTETLKWLGSMSDVSEVSHATGFSAISESVSTSQLIVHSSRVLTPKRHQSESVLYTTEEQAQQQCVSSTRSPQHSPISLQAQVSPSTLNNTLTSSHRHSPSYPPVHQTSHTLYRQQHNHHSTTPELTKSMPEKTSSQTTLANCDASAQKSNISVTISNSEAVVTISPHPPPVPAPKPSVNSCSEILKTSNNLAESQSQTNISGRSHGLPRQSTSLGMVGHKSVSASMDSLSDIKSPYRNNHRLFPVSTYTEPVHSNTSHFVHHPKPQYSMGLQKPQKLQQTTTSTASPSSSSSSASSPSVTGSHGNLHHPKLCSPNYPQPSWQSVAALINDFERTSDQQQSQKYTYLDPNKTHRVPNPALKAFQKNAVQSYFERQQQQQQHHQHQHQHNQNHTHSLDNLTSKTYQQQQSATVRPSSLQNPPQEGVQTVLLRNSLPNNYNTTSGQRPLSEDKISFSSRNLSSLTNKPPSPAPPPPPPRSRSMMPTLLRRSSSASDYAELRDQFIASNQEKLQSQSIKNISNSEKFSFNDCGMPPPPPPPRGRSSMPPRRTSSAADYAAIRDKVLLQQAAALTHQQLHPHQHQHQHQHLSIMSSSYHQPTHHAHHSYQQLSPQNYQSGFPMIPPPLQDGWVPERPPKNPNLRVPSPDLPPPPPGLETETTIPDEPLPPPPPEILQRQPIMEATLDAAMPRPPSPSRRNSFAGASLRKTNFFSRSPSNDSVNVTCKGPPPLVPRKPASIELLQVARPSTATLNQLNSTKVQPELCRATIISSSTRKRPHNLAAATVSSSSIPAIQENLNIKHSPTNPSSPLHAHCSKSSPPPPPLMPRMPSVQQQQQPILLTQQQLSNSLSNISSLNTNTNNQKSRCNSKASYLPRQSLEKHTSSDPDHGSYKMTLHSNEDLVTTTKTSYDMLAQTVKLPNNLPDVLPLGAKLQPSSNTSLNSTPSLRYGSNNNISSNSPTSPQTYTTYAQQQQAQQQQQQQQQRYSTPVLNTFNLSSNFTRSQSFDTNVHNSMTQSPTKYMTQSSLDLKKPINSLETTIEEPNLLDTTIIKDNNSSVSSLSSLSESCNSHEDRLNASNSNNVTNNETANSTSIFRAELVNTTFNNNANNNSNNKKSVTRQESLRENIEKITQLQSQLMSAHITDTSFMGSCYASQILTPQSNSNKTSQANVIDIPKSQDSIKIEEEKLCSDKEKESLPPAPSTPPPIETENKERSTNTYTCSVKSPKMLEKEHNVDSSILSQLDSSTDSLKLVQRSEIVLRVNASTVEAASQTDDITDIELKGLSEVINTKETETPTRITLQPRRRLPIEDDCDKLSKELANMLSPNDALIHILCPPGSKTVADYVTNLYNPNVPLRPSKRHVGTSTLTRSNKPKDDQETNEKITVELKLSELEQMPENCDILKNKVDDLIKNLNNKVRILTKEQTCIDEESAMNDELGNCLLNKLNDKIRPIEASKCRTYISDIGHITGLLLSLSERLARAENNLTTVDENNTEKKSLENKRDRLLEQLTEAKRLKKDIDRRGTSVVSVLQKNLSSEEFADFEYFINMKAKLITDARDIADKIKMGEEIIAALSDTLIQSDC